MKLKIKKICETCSGGFNVNYFDLKDRIEYKNKSATCYNIFSHDFETQEITGDEYYSALKDNQIKMKPITHTKLELLKEKFKIATMLRDDERAKKFLKEIRNIENGE